MTKIALLLSGHIRSLKYTSENISQVVETLKCDVFAHTWDQVEMNSSTWREPDLSYKEGFEIILLQKLNPVKILIEQQSPSMLKLFKSQDYQNVFHNDNSMSGSHYMLYGMKKVFELMEQYENENKINYEIIIRYRYDLICTKINSLNNDINNVKSGMVVMADHNWANALGAKFDGVIISQKKNYDFFLKDIFYRYNNIYKISTKIGGLLPELIITKIIGTRTNVINSCSVFSIIRNNNLIEQVFKEKRKGYKKTIGSSVGYLNFILKNNESYKSFNNYIWHQNNNLINRFISYIVFIFIGRGNVYKRIFFPLKNIFVKNRHAYKEAFDK